MSKGELWREISHEVERLGKISRLAGDAQEEAPPPRDHDSLSYVREDLGDCQRCPLAITRHAIVFGAGNPQADLVIVGEAPGEQEDLKGEPFVGMAGEMLDRMIQNVLGLQRKDVYILNILKCRPPRNRDPLPEEREACFPFLERQISCISPKMILILGAIAHRALFQTSDGISLVRGKWSLWHDIPTMSTFHPAYLLRTPEHKRITHQDLLEVKSRLQG